MKLSDMNILPNHSVFSVGPVWIDGVRYELMADGDTLLKTPETDAEKSDRLALIASIEAILRVKQQKPTA